MGVNESYSTFLGLRRLPDLGKYDISWERGRAIQGQLTAGISHSFLACSLLCGERELIYCKVQPRLGGRSVEIECSRCDLSWAASWPSKNTEYPFLS